MIIVGDCMEKLATLESESVDCCVTSPPYWGLRDYGVDGQLGLEPTPEQYVGHMRMVFEQVRRVLKPEGTLWLNLGDSYVGGGNNRGNNSPISKKQKSNAGATGQVASFGIHKFKSDLLKPKDLVGIPWRMAFALQADGWYLRQDIIWHKPNPMPESVRDRCTKAHEYIFLFAKSQKYFFDHIAILEPFANRESRGKLKGERGSQPYAAARGNDRATSGGFPRVREGRNKRSVWSVVSRPFKGAHFATFPPDLIEPCILAGCPKGGVVLDPFFGAGTVGIAAKKHHRRWIGIELNPEYAKIADKRLSEQAKA